MEYKGQLRLLALAGCVALAACGNKSEAEKVVRAAMTDPDSARFGEFYYNSKTRKGCLAVNGKNQMGGYTGFQQAYVQQTDDGWEEHGIAPLDLESCRRVFADQSN